MLPPDPTYVCSLPYTGGMAHDTLNFDYLLPEGQALLDFQHTGVAYALYQIMDGKGCFIADEQGLGKTAQGIALCKLFAQCKSIEAPKFLFITPPSIKANWEKEMARFAPEWDTQILSGTKPYKMVGNVAIIGYNLLRTWADALIAEGFDAVVMDESHKVKDPKTQQTKAALKIAADVRSRRGAVLLLTGTPLLNRPVELVSQLQMIDRIREISPAPYRGDDDVAWEYAFKHTFCGAKKNSYGKWEYKGASRLDLLNTNLRNRCMIRRLRNEVLDMTETHRVQIDLTLNGDLKPYLDLEANFQGSGDPRSFILELLNALRTQISICKIPAAVEWITDFLADNEGKKLVVWADHKEAQRGIAEALNAAGIKAIYWYEEQGKGRLEEAKAEFNEGDAQVIVCSLKAHGFGHTLVGNGHNVTDALFVEQPWHPGAVTQAEDRINRIGRQAEAVFAHTLVVPGTVDTWLADLINSKWATFRAAIDGTVSDAEIADMQKVVMDKLAAHLLAKYGEGRFPGGEVVA